MSFDKAIGFGVNKENPKGPRIELTPRELDYFYRLGVTPTYIDLKERLPRDLEPEKKIFLPTAKSLGQVREIFASARNSFLIPGQSYGFSGSFFYDNRQKKLIEAVKDPLTSILLDRASKDPALHAYLDKNDHTLRYRCENNPRTGQRTQGDFNEKSGMLSSDIIGGTTARAERELEQREGESIKSSYEAFLRKYRKHKNPAMCDSTPFEELHVGAGYQAARNELGIAIKHPNHPFVLVVEGVEDFWHATGPDMQPIYTARFYEFEFEPKQAWGKAPDWAESSPEAFQKFIYGMMDDIQKALHRQIPHSELNEKSKAEITKEHLDHIYTPYIEGFSGEFAESARGINAFGLALDFGLNLEQALELHAKTIHTNAARLHEERLRYNETALLPEPDCIGHGSFTMTFANDNANEARKLAL